MDKNDDFKLAIEFTLKKTEPWYLSRTSIETYCRLTNTALQSCQELSRERALDIYRLIYWDLAGCDNLPRRLGIAHFDWCVRQGIGEAIKNLQECLGSVADRGFGPLTELRLKEYIHNFGEDALLRCYLKKRQEDCQRDKLSGSGDDLQHFYQLVAYLKQLSLAASTTHTPPSFESEQFDEFEFDAIKPEIPEAETQEFVPVGETGDFWTSPSVPPAATGSLSDEDEWGYAQVTPDVRDGAIEPLSASTSDQLEFASIETDAESAGGGWLERFDKVDLNGL